MEKLEFTDEESVEEQAIKLTEHLSLLCVELVCSAINKIGSEGIIEDFKKTHLKAQEVGPGAMKAHFLYFAIGCLPPDDQTCLLDNIIQRLGVSVDDIPIKPEEEKSLIYMPGGPGGRTRH